MYKITNERRKGQRRTLDLSKPIMCITQVGSGEDRMTRRELLMPIHAPNDYRTIGYDWFGMDGSLHPHWNSCQTWETVQGALEARRSSRSRFINVDLGVLREQV